MSSVVVPVPAPLCPVHGVETRVEWHADTSTLSAFCVKCARHYPLCGAEKHASQYHRFACNLHAAVTCYGFAGHAGDHTTVDGHPFSTLKEILNWVRI